MSRPSMSKVFNQAPVLQSLVPTCFSTHAFVFSRDPEELDELIQVFD